MSESNWEFLERTPKMSEVVDLLVDLGDCYGLPYVGYVDYVQALPQRKKVKKPVEGRPGVMQDTHLDSWTLYMTVAGRIRMLADIAQKHDWCVQLEPEPFTPTGVPGMLQMDEKIVYREYCTIHEVNGDGLKEPVLIGRRPGMAWVPASGGKQAAGTNPFEKVETAARGRAIAAWGIGVLPGSGVASVEEILGAEETERQLAVQQVTGQDRLDVGQDRDSIVEEILTVSEALRQERGIEIDEAEARTVEYLARLGVKDPTTDDRINWENVKTGQLVLLRNSLRTALAKIRDASSDV